MVQAIFPIILVPSLNIYNEFERISKSWQDYRDVYGNQSQPYHKLVYILELGTCITPVGDPSHPVTHFHHTSLYNRALRDIYPVLYYMVLRDLMINGVNTSYFDHMDTSRGNNTWIFYQFASTCPSIFYLHKISRILGTSRATS